MSIYSSETLIKVPFYDCDPMGIVWHGNYVKYMEVARCDLFDKLGYNYLDMKTDGIAFPVAKAEMKYIKPILFNQEIKIIVSIDSLEPSLNIKYIIFNISSGEKIFCGKTMQICIDVNTRESIYTAPKRLKELLNV